MTVGKMFELILSAFAAFRAGNKLEAFLIAWDIVQAILNAIPPQSFGMSAPVMAGVVAIDIEAATTEELMQHVEAMQSSASTADMVGAGPWAAILVPLLIELAKRWWANK